MHKNNIISLVLLLLMVASAIYLGNWSKELKEERNSLEIAKTQLSIDTADLARKRNGLDDLLQKQNKVLDEVKSNSKNPEINRIISKYEVIAEPEKEALLLEKEGFEALVNSNMDVALDRFSRAEKASPSFHMVYEISRLLKSKKGDYSNPSDIKKKIIKSYSWKAPSDLLNKLKSQVK